MELMHALGMLPFLTPSMILICAWQLDAAAQALTQAPADPDTALGLAEGSEKLRNKSYELVEEFSRAAEEVWPKKNPDPLGIGQNSPGAHPAGRVGGTTSGLLALPAPSQEDNIKAMSSLLEASSL